MRYKESSIGISGLILFGLLEGYMYQYEWYAYFFGIAIFLVIATVWQATIESVFSKNFWMYIITPMFFVIALFAFITLVEEPIVRHIVAVLGSFAYWLYNHNVYLYNFDFQRYNENSIENVSSYTNLVTFFLSSIALFAGYTLVGVPFWVLTIYMTVMTGLIAVQWLWAADMTSIRTLVYTAVLIAIVLEIFWAVAFLPTDFYVAGFLVTMSYYVTWGVMKSNLYNILSKKLISRYALIAGVSTLVVVLTTVWY